MNLSDTSLGNTGQLLNERIGIVHEMDGNGSPSNDHDHWRI